MGKIVSLYEPRPYTLPFHQRDQRWAILVMHRRAGKTVAAVNDLIEKAAYNVRVNPRYGYIAPLYNQAKQIAWQYLKDYAKPFNPKISESGLFVELPHNDARISLYGADNPDAFRGLYFDGVVLDEFGNMRQSVWTQVLLPALVDRRGWAVFMGTPNGPNHFRDMFYQYKEDPGWYVIHLPYQKTGVIPDEDIEAIRKLMTEEEFAQEMECSFEASTRGAYYSREIALAEAEGRIVEGLKFDRQPLNFVADLGWSDDTFIGAWQDRPDGHAVQVAWGDNRRTIPFYIEQINSVCSTYGVPRGTVYLPHDARAKSLQTGRSIVEQFIEHDIMPELVPSLSITDGISNARVRFGEFWFDKDRTSSLILALKTYHRSFDEDKKIFSEVPVHDWSSNPADMFRYMAIVARKMVGPTWAKDRELMIQDQLAAKGIVQHGAHYAFNLDDLWETAPKKREVW